MQKILTPDQAMWLANNYMIGIGVITGVLGVLYILVSIMIILKAKKWNVGMVCWGMIPFVRIIVYFVATHKNKKQYKLEKFRENIDMNEEIEL